MKLISKQEWETKKSTNRFGKMKALVARLTMLKDAITSKNEAMVASFPVYENGEEKHLGIENAKHLLNPKRVERPVFTIAELLGVTDYIRSGNIKELRETLRIQIKEAGRKEEDSNLITAIGLGL